MQCAPLLPMGGAELCNAGGVTAWGGAVFQGAVAIGI